VPRSEGTRAIAVDPSGNLYVGNDDNIEVYEPGSQLATLRIRSGVDRPRFLFIDGGRNLYVANYLGPINVYAPGATEPSPGRTIQGVEPYAIAVDAIGYLYVAEYGDVKEYAPESANLVRTITQGIAYPHSILFDSSNDLYVANSGYYEYPSSNKYRGSVSVY